jgi:Flp pilus assembly protein TadG
MQPNRLAIVARIHSQRGQAATEMAFCAVVLFTMMLVIADYSRIFFVSTALNSAARAGAQYGIQNVTTAADLTGMQNAATNDDSTISMNPVASNYCECPGSSSHVSCANPGCSDVRVYCEVDTSATFTTIINYPVIPHTVALTGKAVMRAE